MMNTKRGVIKSYDQATHSAVIELWDADAVYSASIPISHALQFWLVTPGAECIVLIMDDTNPDDACIIAIYGGRAPSDPHFSPIYGHLHTGRQDDGPTL